MFMCMVRANFEGKKGGKSWLKIYTTKIAQLISRHTVQKTGYEAGSGIVRLLSKAGNTGFLRNIKTGCNLPVCITIEYLDF